MGKVQVNLLEQEVRQVSAVSIPEGAICPQVAAHSAGGIGGRALGERENAVRISTLRTRDVPNEH